MTGTDARWRPTLTGGPGTKLTLPPYAADATGAPVTAAEIDDQPRGVDQFTESVPLAPNWTCAVAAVSRTGARSNRRMRRSPSNTTNAGPTQHTRASESGPMPHW